MSFYALQVSFEQIYYAFAEKLDKLFWTRLKEKGFVFEEKRLEHLQKRNTLYFNRPKTLNVSTSPEYKVSMRRTHCLYNNVIYRLNAATNQSINDPREPTLRPDTNQLVLIRDPTVY